MKKTLLMLFLMIGAGAAVWYLYDQRGESDRSETNIPILTDHLMKSGLKAAKEENWQSAIDSFRHAHGASPQLPEPLYNLALAHDRAGHRMVAVCWYEAFLAAAPAAKARTGVENRIRELDALTHRDISRLADAAIEIAIVVAKAEEKAPTEMKLHLLSFFRTVAMVDGLRGDVPHTRNLLDQMRDAFPNDEWWLDWIWLALSDVALNCADRNCFQEAGEFADCMPEAKAVQIRQYISRLKESGKTQVPPFSPSNLNARETIRRWRLYADEIVAGTHHRLHVMDLFAVDPAPGNGPIPEMGIGPYIQSLRWNAASGKQDVIDGVKRLFLTFQEIRFRRGLQANSG